MDLQKELVQAAGRGDKNQVLSLMSKGANIRNSGALRKAVYHSNVDMVRFLISQGANVNEIEPMYSDSVFMTAVERGRKDVLEALLDSGANVNKSSSNGMTPVHKAIIYNKPELVPILLKHGANVNATDNFLNTSLHFACRYEHSEIVKLLLAVPGIEINAMNEFFETPLHFASEKKNKELVLLLLDNGADPDLRDNNGETSFDLCSSLAPTPQYGGGIKEPVLNLSEVIKLFQLSRQERRGMKNENSELETQNKDQKKMLKETKKREDELEKEVEELKEEVEELKRKMKRKEESEHGEKMEGGDEMKTDMKLRAEELERKLETRLEVFKETEGRASQLRDDEMSLEDSIRDVKDRRSQLEASSGRVDMSEKIECLEGEVTAGVKIEVLSLQMALARHFDSSAKDIIGLTKLWKNENSSGACADNIREANLVQVASELEEEGVDCAQQDQTKKLGNLKSKDID